MSTVNLLLKVNTRYKFAKTLITLKNLYLSLSLLVSIRSSSSLFADPFRYPFMDLFKMNKAFRPESGRLNIRIPKWHFTINHL